MGVENTVTIDDGVREHLLWLTRWHTVVYSWLPGHGKTSAAHFVPSLMVGILLEEFLVQRLRAGGFLAKGYEGRQHVVA